ncbi:type III pantothenate kinase [Sunxiuqinia sp. A32]|uniref:type III pantothenate kinase n=1 Tax=Sunxiuqinia sp. A32 TaxID=3461496 RepID=UPI004045B9E4
MLLAIDIGNSNIVFGINKNEQWNNVWRIQTDALKTADEYEVIFRSLFTNGKVCRNDISNVVISSVVPSLVNDFVELITNLTNQKALIVVLRFTKNFLSKF